MTWVACFYYIYGLLNKIVVQDVGLSKDLNESFRKHLTNSGDTLEVDFSIQVNSGRIF